MIHTQSHTVCVLGVITGRSAVTVCVLGVITGRSTVTVCVLGVITGSTNDEHRFVAATTEVERQPDGNSSDHDEPCSAG